MIVNDGKVQLLDQQRSFLATCKWKLFTNNFTITAATVLSDLTEAAWTGYAPVTAGTWNVAVIVAGKAYSNPATLPTFMNTSGGGVSCYGWFLTESSGTTLIAAVNFGLVNIPDAAILGLNPSITDDQA